MGLTGRPDPQVQFHSAIKVESAKTEQVRVYVVQSESYADGKIGAPGLFGVAGGTNRSR